ncbi:hypothetical protein BGZ60DRAFT_528184 [Tricladium varicosporioides]|nr:hypothetical protein BGZ60DRAFT_528184 [Hymenoscyphus varicosporioides]
MCHLCTSLHRLDGLPTRQLKRCYVLLSQLHRNPFPQTAHLWLWRHIKSKALLRLLDVLYNQDPIHELEELILVVQDEMQNAANKFEELREEGEVIGRKDENWKGWREEVKCEDSVSNYLMGGRYVSGRTSEKVGMMEGAVRRAREKEIEKTRRRKEEKQYNDQTKRKAGHVGEKARKATRQGMRHASQRLEKAGDASKGISAQWQRCSKPIRNRRGVEASKMAQLEMPSKMEGKRSLATTMQNVPRPSRSNFASSSFGLTSISYNPIDPSDARKSKSIRLVLDWLEDCDSAVENDRSDVESLSSFIGGILKEPPSLDAQVWAVRPKESITGTSYSYLRSKSSAIHRRESRYTSLNSSIAKGKGFSTPESTTTKQTPKHTHSPSSKQPLLDKHNSCVYNRPYHIEPDSYFRTMVRITPKDSGKGVWSRLAARVGLGKKVEPAPKARKRRRYRNPVVEMRGGRSKGRHRNFPFLGRSISLTVCLGARSDVEDRENGTEI